MRWDAEMNGYRIHQNTDPLSYSDAQDQAFRWMNENRLAGCAPKEHHE